MIRVSDLTRANPLVGPTLLPTALLKSRVGGTPGQHNRCPDDATCVAKEYRENNNCRCEPVSCGIFCIPVPPVSFHFHPKPVANRWSEVRLGKRQEVGKPAKSFLSLFPEFPHGTSIARIRTIRANRPYRTNPARTAATGVRSIELSSHKL